MGASALGSTTPCSQMPPPALGHHHVHTRLAANYTAVIAAGAIDIEVVFEATRTD